MLFSATIRENITNEVDRQVNGIVEKLEQILKYVDDEEYDRTFIHDEICSLLDDIG